VVVVAYEVVAYEMGVGASVRYESGEMASLRGLGGRDWNRAIERARS
jgi:hypothetical protein